MTSATLMFATILVYVSIPELLNLCGKCLVCYLISLTTFYTTVSYVYLKAGKHISLPMCTALAYTIYFAYLSTIIWLNQISYNFWKVFRLDGVLILFASFFWTIFTIPQHQSSISFMFGYQAIHQIFRVCLGAVNALYRFCLFIRHHWGDSKLLKARLWHWTVFSQRFVAVTPFWVHCIFIRFFYFQKH